MSIKAKDLIDRVGITYRQLDFWCRQGWIKDEDAAKGTGHHRWFGGGEYAVAIRMADLVHAGVRPAVAAKLARGDSQAVFELSAALRACEGVVRG